MSVRLSCFLRSLLFFVLLVSPLYAQDDFSDFFEKYIVLQAESPVEDQPQGAYFIVRDTVSDEFIRQNAFILQTVGSEEKPKWHALLPLLKDAYDPAGIIQYVAYFPGESGNVVDSGVQEIVLDEPSRGLFSAQEMRAELLKKKESLKRFAVQIREQEKALSRLQKDLGVIGYFNKAVQIDREAAQIEKETENINKQLAVFQSLLKEVKKQKTPAQFTLQKRELSSDVTAVRAELKKLDNQSAEYKQRSETQLLEDLNLIERTRNLNLEELRKELIRLRGIRQQKESFTSPAIP